MSGLIPRFKARVRDAIPAAWRVPAKYWHARLTGSLEAEMALLSALVRPGAIAVDVGANYGVYGYVLARLGAQVEMFEPNPACLVALDGWARHKLAVRVHPVALSSGPGTAQLYVPVEEDGTEHDAAGSLTPATGPPMRSETVVVRALDSFGFTQADLIKIDVEGHEDGVITGALQTIAAAQPALLIEIEQRHRADPIEAAFDRITQLGYAGYFLIGHQLVDIARFRVDEHQPLAALGSRSGRYCNNFLFLPHRRVATGEYRGVSLI